MTFRIEGMYQIDASTVVLVRSLGTGSFSLRQIAAPRLAGVPIRRFVDDVRRLRPDGSPDLGVFAFVLEDSRDEARLSVGQIAELES